MENVSSLLEGWHLFVVSWNSAGRWARVAVRVHSQLSIPAAVRNAVQSVQKIYQWLFLFAHLIHSVVYSHLVSGTLASDWAHDAKE